MQPCSLDLSCLICIKGLNMAGVSYDRFPGLTGICKTLTERSANHFWYLIKPNSYCTSFWRSPSVESLLVWESNKHGSNRDGRLSICCVNQGTSLNADPKVLYLQDIKWENKYLSYRVVSRIKSNRNKGHGDRYLTPDRASITINIKYYYYHQFLSLLV